MTQVTQEDIQKLAQMVRIHVTDEEGKKLAESFESIIAYVDQISGLDTTDNTAIDHPFYNIGRAEDTEHQAVFSKDIIMQDMPAREEDYLKVKKIL